MFVDEAVGIRWPPFSKFVRFGGRMLNLKRKLIDPLVHFFNVCAFPFIVIGVFEKYMWHALKPIPRWLFVAWQVFGLLVSTYITVVYTLVLALGSTGYSVATDTSVTVWTYIGVGLFALITWVLTSVVVFLVMLVMTGAPFGLIWVLCALFLKIDIFGAMFVPEHKPKRMRRRVRKTKAVHS